MPSPDLGSLQNISKNLKIIENSIMSSIKYKKPAETMVHLSIQFLFSADIMISWSPVNKTNMIYSRENSVVYIGLPIPLLIASQLIL